MSDKWYGRILLFLGLVWYPGVYLVAWSMGWGVFAK